jgi:predicted PurR-regulated permease PerM
MEHANNTARIQPSSRQAIEAGIHIGLIALLTYLCFKIIQPFAMLVIWGVIIAVAVFPLFQRIRDPLGRPKVAAALLTLVALMLLLVPSVMFSNSAIEGSMSLAEGLTNGTLTIPPPSEKVASWPLIGESLHKHWQSASDNLPKTLAQFGPQLKKMGEWLLSSAFGLGFGVLKFAFSIVIAGVFMAKSEDCHRAVITIFHRLAGEQGTQLVDTSRATIQSVAQGVLGVAAIQAFLAGIGFLVAGVPGAGLWTLLVLLLAIIQLPPILVLVPIIIYVFSTSSTGVAVIFLLWNIVVLVSDPILKPLVLGRGTDIPTLVVLIGALGGMMFSGIIGLFVGAVVLSLGFQLFKTWLELEKREITS